MDTSAKDNYGVTSIFQQVAERVLRFRENGTELPVTPGASVNERGMVKGATVEDSADYAAFAMKNDTKKSDTEEDKDDYRQNKNHTTTTNGSHDQSNNTPRESNMSSSKLMMCDSSPLACGMFGDSDNVEDSKSGSCAIT